MNATTLTFFNNKGGVGRLRSSTTWHGCSPSWITSSSPSTWTPRPI